MTEAEETQILANRILDRVNADPDDDLAMLSRQLLRADERIQSLVETLATTGSELKSLGETCLETVAQMRRVLPPRAQV